MAKNASKQLNCAEPWEGYSYSVFKGICSAQGGGPLGMLFSKSPAPFFHGSHFILLHSESWYETQASHTGLGEAAIQRGLERET